MSAPTFVTERLDQFERSLPSIPARVFHLQRTLAGVAYDRTAVVANAISDSTRNLLETAKVSGRTVTGQARAAGDDLLGTARTGFKTVSGQAAAQGRKVASTATRTTTDLVDSAIDAVGDAPGSGTPYEQWTKADLVERARELGIEGRTGLNKKQLIAKLRAV